MSFAKPGATTSELVANLIKENSLSLDADTATDLVMGIEEGSSNFASPEVTPETFETFAYLLRNGGQRGPRTKLSPADFPIGSIPTQPLSTPAQAEPHAGRDSREGRPAPRALKNASSSRSFRAAAARP